MSYFGESIHSSCGRTSIKLNIPDRVLNSDDLNAILSKSIKVHFSNVQNISYLYNYYLGKQPILERSDKKVRPEINNKTVENWAKYISDFKVGFIWGEPIQLIKAKNEKPDDTKNASEDAVDTQVDLINRYYELNHKHRKDRDCGFWTTICGVSYMACLPSDSEDIPFELYDLDPRCTFIIYSCDFKKEPLMAVTYNAIEDIDGTYHYDMTAYTKRFTYRFKQNNEWDTATDVEVTPNLLNVIPIVEFKNNVTRTGAFEAELPLLDNINLICSDRMNDISQAVQWFMKFINVDIDEETYDKFKAKGVIVVKGEPGNTPVVDCVTNALNQTQIQVFKDDMIRSLHILCHVPERNANPGDNTGQALIVGQGWSDAESNAKDIEASNKESQEQLLKIAIAICKNITSVTSELKATKLENIDIKYTRNRSDNLLVKTQALKNMLDSGVHPLVAFKICGLFSDPQKAYEQSKHYIDLFYSSTKNENMSEPDIDTGASQNLYNQSQQLQKNVDNRKSVSSES